jgi:hypothetical protein
MKPKYWAFISYSHHDKRVARRLALELGKCVVPQGYRTRVSSGTNRFTPIYLDEQESGANSALSAELRGALESSLKLIVVCSPFAALSATVSSEIRFFQSLGRSNDILCVIASGTPNATDSGANSLEAFPLPLRESIGADGQVQPIPILERPLAVSIGLESAADWRTATAQIAAGIVEISKGDLERLRQRSSIKRALTVIVVTMPVCGILTWGTWAFVWPHSTYAKSVVRHFGAWEEVDLISKVEAQHRSRSFRFERHGARGSLTSVHLENGFGYCPEEGLTSITGDKFDTECSAARGCGVIFDAPDGTVRQETVLDQRNNPIETILYSEPNRAILTARIGECGRIQTGVKLIKIQRFNDGGLKGFDQQYMFFDADESPRARPNQQYAFGLRFAYDDAGRLIRQSSLDERGNLKSTKAGPASIELSYNPRGDISRVTYEDEEDRPTLDDQGRSTIAFEADAYGNVASESYFGKTMERVYDKNAIHKKANTFGPHGELRNQQYFAPDLSLTLGPEHYAERRVIFDIHGYTVEEQYLGTQGKNVRGGMDDCYITRKIVTATGEQISRKCFLESGQPDYTLGGFHEYRLRYDSRENETEESYWGPQGEPVYCQHDSGDTASQYASCPIHRVVNEFDSNDKRIHARFFDPAGHLVSNGDAVAGFDLSYNPIGYFLGSDWVGPDGYPTATANGIYRQRAEPDEFGRDKVITNFGKDGNAGPNISGVTIQNFQYDPRGNIAVVENRDSNGKSVVDDNGVFRQLRNYDVFRNWTDVRNYGMDNKPTRDSDGDYADRFASDRFQRLVEIESLDPSGAITSNSAGVAITRIIRDEQGAVVKIRFFDTRKQPIRNDDGVAGQDRVNDERGRLVVRRYVDVDGSLHAGSNGKCIEAVIRDKLGRIVESQNRDCDGHPIPESTKSHVVTTRRQWNERGQLLRETYFDSSGGQAVNESGIAGQEFQYNERGQVAEKRYLSLDGSSPSASSEGGTVYVRFTYDEMGFLHEIQYLTEGRHAWQIVRYQRDKYGRETLRQLLGPDEKPFLNPTSGRSQVRSRYDSWGRLLEESSFGLKGEPTNRKDLGWQRQVRKYNKLGSLASQVCYRTDGSSVSCGTD